MAKDDTLESVVHENEKFKQEVLDMVRSLKRDIATTMELVTESARKRQPPASPPASSSNETAMFIKGQEHAVSLFATMMQSTMQLVSTIQDAHQRGMDDRAALEEEIRAGYEEEGGEDDELGDIGKLVGQAHAIGSALTGKANGSTDLSGLGELASVLNAATKSASAGSGGPPSQDGE